MIAQTFTTGPASKEDARMAALREKFRVLAAQQEARDV